VLEVPSLRLELKGGNDIRREDSPDSLGPIYHAVTRPRGTGVGSACLLATAVPEGVNVEPGSDAILLKNEGMSGIGMPPSASSRSPGLDGKRQGQKLLEQRSLGTCLQGEARG
jgi:hypothetical protein